MPPKVRHFWGLFMYIKERENKTYYIPDDIQVIMNIGNSIQDAVKQRESFRILYQQRISKLLPHLGQVILTVPQFAGMSIGCPQHPQQTLTCSGCAQVATGAYSVSAEGAAAVP